MTKQTIRRKIDWLELEQQIRETLRAVREGNAWASDALANIDGLLGDATGRGYELPGNDYDETVAWLDANMRQGDK